MYQSGNEIHIIDYIEIFNSNTFSTFISMVICMAYKFFTTDENKQELDSGLSRKWIWLTILATIIYPYLYKTVTAQNKEELQLVMFPNLKITFEELFDLGEY